MEWWYWFGMWVAAVSGVLLTWWVLIDSWRGRTLGVGLWPIATMLGMAIQLPAFVLDETMRGARAGSLFALVGVLGIVLVGVSAIAHFSRGEGRVRGLECISGPVEPVSSISTSGTRSADRVLLGSPRPAKPEDPEVLEKAVQEPVFDGSATMLDTDAGPTLLAEQPIASVDVAATLLSDLTIVEEWATLLAEAQSLD